MLSLYECLSKLSINTTEMVRSIFEVKERMIIKEKTLKNEEL